MRNVSRDVTYTQGGHVIPAQRESSSRSQNTDNINNLATGTFNRNVPLSQQNIPGSHRVTLIPQGSPQLRSRQDISHLVPLSQQNIPVPAGFIPVQDMSGQRRFVGHEERQEAVRRMTQARSEANHRRNDSIHGDHVLPRSRGPER